MNINESAVIAAPVDEVWQFVTDVPRVGGCLPGAGEVADLGNDTYGGAVRVKVGAIAVRLEGTVRMVEQDKDKRVAILAIQASDRRIKGSVNATTTMAVVEIDPTSTELRVEADAAVLGKLGQFGQAVVQKKTRQMLDEFVGNMSRQLNPADTFESETPADARVGTRLRSSRLGGSRGTATAVRSGSGLATASVRSESNARRSPLPLRTTVAAGGVVVGLVGAIRREPAWSILGLSLVLWGSLDLDRLRPHHGQTTIVSRNGKEPI